MKITEAKRGAWTVLTLEGRIDHNGADELERVLLPQMAGGSVALDFQGASYITSSGFRVLMRAEREQAAKKGRLLLGNMPMTLRQLFDVAGLSACFKIVPDLSAATGAK